MKIVEIDERETKTEREDNWGVSDINNKAIYPQILRLGTCL